MSRLIVSGCSYTEYEPTITYPVFLSQSFDETYNLGLSGAGNEYIFHSIVDADTRFKLTPDDKVIIVWSGFFRIDTARLTQQGQNNTFLFKGNGDWNHWDESRRNGLESFLVEEAAVKKSLNYIAFMARYLKSKNIDYVFSSLYDMRGCDLEILEEIYDEHFIMPSGLDTPTTKLYKTQAANGIKTYGSHPSQFLHQQFAEAFANKLGIQVTHHADIEELDLLVGGEIGLFAKVNKICNHPIYHTAVKSMVQHSTTTVPSNCLKYNRNTVSILKEIFREVSR